MSSRFSYGSRRVQICACTAMVLTLALVPVLARVHAAGGRASVAASHSNTSATKKADRSNSSRLRAVVVSKSSASLGPLETIVQTLNNCGPSSVAAVLAYWRVYLSEAEVASVMRADNSFWGMSPVYLPAYAQSLGMRALVGYGGTEKLVKALIANGFPVIVSQYVSSFDPIRHYRPIEAYDNRAGIFVSADPYLGAAHVISYTAFNAIWSESDNRFQVVYPLSYQSLVGAVLRAAGWNKQRTYSRAIAWEEAQIRTSAFQSAGSWIWYNGFADIAFDEAQLGQYRKAEVALASANRQKVGTVLIGWVADEIQRLQSQA
jgi:predicted double-glycine peptidase